jgi:hypothetical protein
MEFSPYSRLASPTPLLPSGLIFARFNLALWIVVVSALLNVSATLPTYTYELRSKNKGFGVTRNGHVRQRLRLRASAPTRPAKRLAPCASFSTLEASRLGLKVDGKHT